MNKFDVFGNPHRKNEYGYCECWQCPKPLRKNFDGTHEWWQPKPLDDNSKS